MLFTQASAQQFTYQWGHPKPQGNIVYSGVFNDESDGWAVAGAGTILQTKNNGAQWDLLPGVDSVTSDFFDIVLTQQGTLIVSGDSGIILRSTDKGITWELQKFQDAGRLMDLSLIPGGGISAAGEQGILLISDDDGISWTNKGPGGSGYARHHCWKSASEAYVVGFNMFYKTLDRGEHWSVVDTLIGFGLNEVFFVTNEVGYTLEDFSYYQTADGGANWEKIEGFSGILYKYRTLILDESHWFRVTFGEGGEFWESTDGGIQWTNLFMHNTIGFVSLFKNGNRIFFTSDAGDIFYTDNLGLNIINSIVNLSVEPNAPISIIASRPDGTAFAQNQPNTGTNNQSFYRSDDGGKNWYIPDQAPGLRWIYDICFLNNQKGVVGSYSDIRFTLNGGTTWNSALLPDEYRLTNFDSPDSMVYFAAAYLIKNSQGFGNIYKSSDNGASWQRVSGGLPLNGLYMPNISFADNSTGYISYLENNTNKIFKTTDGGLNWSKINATGISSYISSMLWISADTGFATVPNDDFGIFRSVNGGLNWLKVSENPARKLSSDFKGHLAAINPESDFFQESTDGGVSWNNYYPPMAAYYPGGGRSITAIYATEKGYLLGGKSNRLMVATRKNGIITRVNDSDFEREKTKPELVVFPTIINQSTGFIEITINTGANEFIQLNLINLQGHVLKTLINKNLLPGNYTFRFDRSPFSENSQGGYYLLTLKTKNSVQSKKILYIK